MNEELLQMIFEMGLYQHEELVSDTREKVEILYPGIRNPDSGPDFLNAKVKIGDTLWAGNIEIHLKSGDWYRHNHHCDKAYNNVILHIVNEIDKPTVLQNNQIVPTVKIQIPEQYKKRYSQMIRKEGWILCEKTIGKTDPLVFDAWLHELTMQRLEQKSQRILLSLKQNSFDWEESFYLHLARNFGFNLNTIPFELLARNTSLKIVHKHRDRWDQTEAILFGQAGFLEQGNLYDEYYKLLRQEYQVLQNKFELKPIPVHLWKFSKSRPGNFPTIRIAQFASIIHHSENLFSKVLELHEYKEIVKLFSCSASEYWNTHYHFNKTSKTLEKHLGKTGIDSIIINTVVPFLYLYGKLNKIQKSIKNTLSLLEKTPAEQFSSMKRWKSLNVRINNAADSQALLQLKNNYCNKKKCLNCQIGKSMVFNEEKR